MWNGLLGILKYVYEEKASFGVVTKNVLVLGKKHFSSLMTKWCFAKLNTQKCLTGYIPVNINICFFCFIFKLSIPGCLSCYKIHLITSQVFCVSPQTSSKLDQPNLGKSRERISLFVKNIF